MKNLYQITICDEMTGKSINDNPRRYFIGYRESKREIKEQWERYGFIVYYIVKVTRSQFQEDFLDWDQKYNSNCELGEETDSRIENSTMSVREYFGLNRGFVVNF